MALNLHGDASVPRTPGKIRPKGADVDAPEGVGKLLLRRKVRRDLKRNLHPAGCQCVDCRSLCHDAVSRPQV